MIRGAYYALPPARILDTRNGSVLAANTILNVKITGQGGVPAGGVSAVVMNVTVTNPTAASFLTVWPAGVPRPTASNLNWTVGETVPNLVEVELGVNGQVSVFNADGVAQVIFDVAGYVAAPTGKPRAAGLFNPMLENRVLDTRKGTGGVPAAPVGPGQTINVRMTGTPNIPDSGVAGVVVNVTVTGPTAQSYLTVFPTGTAQPTVSNLNFLPGQTTSNRAIVKVGSGGSVSFYNAFGAVNVIAEVAGWFTDGSTSAGGSLFVGLKPARIADTRRQQEFFATGAVAAGAVFVLPVAGHGGVPAIDATVPPTAVVLNVTVANPSAASYVTVWPHGVAKPIAFDLSFRRYSTASSLVVVKLGADGSIDLYNNAGSTDVIVDVVGWYG